MAARIKFKAFEQLNLFMYMQFLNKNFTNEFPSSAWTTKYTDWKNENFVVDDSQFRTQPIMTNERFENNAYYWSEMDETSRHVSIRSKL